jgi:hypothetical protein
MQKIKLKNNSVTIKITEDEAGLNNVVDVFIQCLLGLSYNKEGIKEAFNESIYLD